ncbi:MAG: threonine ammonia-lyase [Candidatus Latescibacteria bacterium]|nr:threonine ammonia-lyase [Candidatus Latescibacterota bacterium]
MVTLEDIRRAAAALEGQVVVTPCAPSQTLSEITGAQVVLKFENLQFTASFKERGALNRLNSLSRLSPAQRQRGVIAMSAGNHAQAVAYHAQRLGIPAVIVMPRFTPHVKVERTRHFNAEVILQGENFDEASQCARQLAGERELLLVHPYDDEEVMAGQGTLALEMLAVHPDLEVLVVPVGGGGLIAGVATAAKGVKPSIEVVGVQASRFPAMLQMLQGRPVECGQYSLAEGIAVKHPGRLTLEVARQRVDEILLVDEEDIERAVLLLLEVEKTVVEGAGAAGLAALVRHPARFSDKKVGLVLSGGNIDLLPLSSIIQRGLVRTGRLVRLRAEVRDVPGALAQLTQLLAGADANIVEVNHRRAFTSLPLQSAEVEFVLQTRGQDHLEHIVEELGRAGHRVWLPDK